MEEAGEEYNQALVVVQRYIFLYRKFENYKSYTESTQMARQLDIDIYNEIKQ